MINPYWTPVVGVVLAISTLGLTARMVINTVAHNILRIKAASAAPLPAAQEERIARMEAELSSLKEEMARLSAVENFYTQLQAPPAPPRPSSPPGGT